MKTVTSVFLIIAIIFVSNCNICPVFADSTTDYNEDFNTYDMGVFQSDGNFFGTSNTNRSIKEFTVVEAAGDKKLCMARVSGGTGGDTQGVTRAVEYVSPLTLEFKLTLHNAPNFRLYFKGLTHLLQIKNRKFNSYYFNWADGTADADKAAFSAFVFQYDKEYSIKIVCSGVNNIALYVNGGLITDKLLFGTSFNSELSSIFRFSMDSYVDAAFDSEGNVDTSVDYSRVYLDDIVVARFLRDNEFIYPVPRWEDIVTAVKNHNGYSHPRILFSDADVAAMKERILTDAAFTAKYNNVKVLADQYLSGAKNVSVSSFADYQRDIIPAIPLLSLMYRITGNVNYAKKAWDLLSSGFAFTDWDLGNTIETGSTAMIYGIAYDGLYTWLDNGQKKQISDIVFQRAIEPAYQVYTGGTPPANMATTWPNCDHNWNFVCNCGFAVGALAFMEVNEKMCGVILENAIRGLKPALKNIGENGGWNEGVMYWSYGFRYLYTFLASLDTAAGSDYGLKNSPGLEASLLFPLYLTGGGGSFNFHDSTDTPIDEYVLMYGAKYYGNSDYAALREMNMRTWEFSPGAYDLIWYVPAGQMTSSLQWDKYFEGVETAVFKNDGEDLSALFAGLHGGPNNVNHGSLDDGTFILSALGERWAIDLGNDSYSLPGYEERTVDGRRWTYYRNRAEGSNTLVINPDGGNDQITNASADITEFSSNRSGGYAVMNLTSAYKNASGITRTLRLNDGRRNVELEDTIVMNMPSDIYWFMHTRADITLIDGGKAALLSQNGKKLMVELTGTPGAVFYVTDAKPLPVSPNPAGQNPNSGIRKLAIHLAGVRTAHFRVLFTPLSDTNGKVYLLASKYGANDHFEGFNYWQIDLNTSRVSAESLMNDTPAGGKTKWMLWDSFDALKPLRGYYEE